MLRHIDIDKLFGLLKQGKVTVAGNVRLKIYGTLQCKSGKRMHRKNRVFFINEQEAIRAGYRPCGHCMRAAYQDWKRKTTSSSQGRQLPL